MKNELEFFRKLPIADFSLNIKKFREYLDYCKKNNLVNEKVSILESLVISTNDKSATGASNEVLEGYTNLCVITVIFSDFEIENFLKISNFTPNFQKTVLIKAIHLCHERHKELSDQILLKFNFWVLIIANKNISANILASPNSEDELNQSITSLKVYIEANAKSKKPIVAKAAFELGYYYFLNNNKKTETQKYFLKFAQEEIELQPNYTFYFTARDIDKILNFAENQEEFENLTIDENNQDQQMICDDSSSINTLNTFKMIDFYNEEKFIQNDFQTFLGKMAIDDNSKHIFNTLSINDAKLLEMYNFEEISSFSKCLLIQYFKNYNKRREYVEAQMENIVNKLNQLESIQEVAGKSEFFQLKKEIAFHLILFKLIQAIFNKEEKLPKNFLQNLSTEIMKYTIIDDLEINGLIHGLLINFTKSFDRIVRYFKDYIEFFKQVSSNLSVENVALINYINFVLRVIEYIINIPEGFKEAIIEGEIQYQIYNTIFFWLQSLKENKTNTSDNILFILIKTIKNSNFLIIMKVIYLGVINFLVEKRKIIKPNNDEVYTHLVESHPNIFKIENLINENKNNKKFASFKIIFKEDKRGYNYDVLNIDFFINTLFNLVEKIEKKITKYSQLCEVEVIERRINLIFCENDNSTKKLNNKQSDIYQYLKYYTTILKDFKTEFCMTDFFLNFEKIDSYYIKFRNLIDETILIKFIYILHLNNKPLEAAILLQYKKNLDYELAYKLLKLNIDNGSIQQLTYIWKISYFELLANIYYNKDKMDHLNEVTSLIKRTSNHQFFKRHPLRKLFKILNFMKFIDNYSK